MRNLIVKIGSSLVLAIVLAVVSVQAQSSKVFTGEIPFNFQVGDKVLPAGEYLIRVDDLQRMPIFTIENKETRQWTRMPVPTNGKRSKSDNASLIFNRYGNSYVLKEMVAPEFGLTAPKAKNVDGFGKKLNQPAQTIALLLQR